MRKAIWLLTCRAVIEARASSRLACPAPPVRAGARAVSVVARGLDKRKKIRKKSPQRCKVFGEDIAGLLPRFAPTFILHLIFDW